MTLREFVENIEEGRGWFNFLSKICAGINEQTLVVFVQQPLPVPLIDTNSGRRFEVDYKPHTDVLLVYRKPFKQEKED